MVVQKHIMEVQEEALHTKMELLGFKKRLKPNLDATQSVSRVINFVHSFYII